MSVEWAVTARRGDFLLNAACRSEARILAVEGASGAGKTTLLYALAGLIPVISTRLAVDGITLVDTAAGLSPPPHRRHIGYVFQDARLFPHMSVAANIGYGRRFGSGGMSVDAALKLLDLTGFEHRWPASLSGGEMRRVAIARALCAGPQLLLLDEPFAGLDAARREALIPYLLRLRQETDLPMLLVSHDSRDVDALAEDRVRIDFGRVVDATASGHGLEQPL